MYALREPDGSLPNQKEKHVSTHNEAVISPLVNCVEKAAATLDKKGSFCDYF